VTFQVPDEDAGDGSFTVDAATNTFTVVEAFPTPITITEGAAQSTSLYFDTVGMLGFQAIGGGNYIFFPMPPSVNLDTPPLA